MTVFKFVIKRTLKEKTDVFFLLLIPIISVFISAETWLPIPLGFHLYGIILMIMSSKICKTMMVDREKKVVVRISAAPISHLRYLAENLMAYGFILSVINFLVIGLGVLRYGSDVFSPIKMLLLFSAFSICSIGFSISWYALFTHAETAYSILGGLQISLAMIGGMFWPVEIMPEIVQKIIRILPTYWYSLGLRQVVYQGYEGSFILTLGVLLLFGLFFILMGSRKRLG